MDRPAQGPRTFAVYHPNLEDPFFPAGGDVVRQQVFDFPGLKGVQVQDSVDGKFQGLGFFHFYFTR